MQLPRSKTFDAAFAGVTLDTSILKLTRRQAEFVKPVWQYLDSAVSSSRIRMFPRIIVG